MSNDLNLRIRLSADGQQLIGTLRNAESSVDSFGSKVAGGIVTAAKWAAGIAAAGAALTTYIVATNTDAIRQTDQFAQSLNMSTQTMTEWQYASEQMGLSGDGLQQVFQDVQDKLGDLTTTGGGEAVDLFENLNLQMDELITLSPDQQLLAIADAMDSINQNQKVFFMESLASDSTRLLPLLQDNAAELRRLQLEAQVLGVSISDIDAAKVTQAGQAMDRTQGLMGGLANEITIELAPVLTGVSNLLVDNAVEAGGFGDAVKATVDGAVTGLGFVLDVGQQLLVWSKHAQIGMMTLGQYGTGAMASIADTTANVINTVLYPFQKYYSWLIDKFASLVELGVSLGGPFADEFAEASQWLKGLSQDVEQFTVEGSDIIALNESMKNSLVTASEELDALLNANAPSEDLKSWVQQLREESEAAAQAQVDLRNKTGKTGDVVGSGVDVSPYEKLTAELESQLELVGLSAREQAIETQVRKLSAQATDEQVAEVKRLAGALYDTAAAQKTAAEEQAAFKKQLDDANTAAKRFLQDGNLGEIEGLESIQDQLQEAMSVEGITDKMKEDFIDATDKIQDRISAIKFDNMTNGLAAGMSSLQSMFESGTEGYKAMEIGLAAVTAAQAVYAVINQASGDPYTAFARMAAMAAAVAQLGVSINGAGSFDTAERRQVSQGTGTVLGDSSAKSESILRSNETIAETVEQIVGINRSMLDALLSLEVSINGAALQITRRWDDNITAPSNVELSGVSAVSGIFSSISEALDILDLGKVFAAAIGASVKGKDSGLVLEASTLDQLTAQSYTTWKERKNWLDDYDREWDYSALDPQITQQLRLVMAGIADSVSTGADQLGLSADAIDQAVQSFALERTLISLKDLTGEEQQAELQAVFSTIFDDLSGHVMPWLTEFQQAGEGLGETLSRLVTETSAVDNVVSMLGLTFSTVDDHLRAKTNLVSVLGGLEAFVSAYSSFSEAFLDEEQQFSNARDQLQSAFSQYDAILPATRADYLALVQAQDAATESGTRNIAKLFELSDAADEYYSMLEDREDERLAVARERSGLMRQIYELEGNSAAALQITRDAELAALDESNRALQQRIWMLQDEADQETLLTSQAATAFGQLSQAIDAELEALNTAWSDRQQALTDEIQAVSQSASAIQTFIDALSNTLSQLQATTQQDFIDAQQQAFDWLNQGQAAWTDPGNYQDALGHLGNINADWYASAVDYERDKKITANALTDAKALASSQLSVEDQTLQTLQNTLTLEERAYDQSVSALEATREFWQQEIDAINGVDDAVLSVEDAIQKLKDALREAWQNIGVTNDDIRAWLEINAGAQLTVDDIVSAMQQAGVTGSQVADALALTPTDNLSTTEQSIRQWLNANPNASDDEVASAMRIWGVSVERLAEMLNMTVTEVQQRYVATVPEQVLDKAHLPTSAGLSDTDVETWLNQNGGATLAQVADAMREFGVTLEQMARVSGWSLEAVEAAYLGLADGQGRTPDQLYVDGRQEQPASQPAVPAPTPTIRYPQDGGISDAEVQAWLAQNSGATLAQIADAMDAFGVTVQQMARATGWSVSDVQSAYQIHGSHANGLDEVPFDNYLAFLHKGEMVVPAQQSDYLRTAETSKQFKALVQEMAALRADNKTVLAQISKHTKDSANTAKALSRGQPVYIMENL